MNRIDWAFFENIVIADRIYLVFGIVISILLLIVMALVIITLYLRFRNVSREKRFAKQEERWTPLILDYMSGDATASEVYNAIELNEALRFVNFIVKHLQRIRGSDADFLRALAKPYIHLLSKRLEDKNPARRARALKTLSVLAIQDYQYDLLRGLSDRSPLVAMVSARSISQHGQIEFLTDIMDQIARFSNWNKSYLISIITSFGSNASPVLTEVLQNRKSAIFARVIAADTLAELNYINAAKIIPETLESSANSELIAALLRLATSVGDPSIMSSIRPYLAHQDHFVRGPAYRAIGKLGDIFDLPMLEIAVRDDSPWVSRYAAISLLDLGGADRLEAMIAAGHDRSALLQEVINGMTRI